MAKTRFTVDLSPDEYRQLCALLPQTGAPTKAALVRQAISLLDALIAAQKRGAEIIARAGSKEQTVFLLATGGTILAPPRPAK